VIIVSGFSAFVDWRKEKEFVKRSQADEDAKMVRKSILSDQDRYYFI